jgi:hypothetical protein
MMNLVFAMAAIGTVYLLDALYELTFKDDRDPIIRFVLWSLVALTVKIIVRFADWAISF